MPRSSRAAADTSDPPFAVPNWPGAKIEFRKTALLKKNPRNAKLHPAEQIAMVRKSIRTFGWTMPVLVDEKDILIAGHARLEAALQEGISEVPVIVARGWSKTMKLAYLEADNRLTETGGWNDDMRRDLLAELADGGFDMEAMGWGTKELEAFLSAPSADGGSGPILSLADRFGLVPFSVFNAREGVWQDRKRAWLALGLQSEVGRGENLLKFSDSVALDGKAYNERFKGKNRQIEGGEVG